MSGNREQGATTAPIPIRPIVIESKIPSHFPTLLKLGNKESGWFSPESVPGCRSFGSKVHPYKIKSSVELYKRITERQKVDKHLKSSDIVFYWPRLVSICSVWLAVETTRAFSSKNPLWARIMSVNCLIKSILEPPIKERPVEFTII